MSKRQAGGNCGLRRAVPGFVMSTEVETSLAILLFARSSLTSFRGPVGAATAPRTRRWQSQTSLLRQRDYPFNQTAGR